MIDYLSNDKQIVTIGQGMKNSYTEETNTVGYKQDRNAPIPTEIGILPSINFISLGHELAHAEDDLKGSINSNKTWRGSYENHPESEKYATHRENQFRAENNIPLRTHYGVIESFSESFTPDYPTQIINKNRESIYIPNTKYIKK